MAVIETYREDQATNAAIGNVVDFHRSRTRMQSSPHDRLFRSEALRAQGDDPFGEILLTRPLHRRLIAALCAAISVAVILYVVYGTYTRRVTVAGMLAPTAGVIRIIPPVAGVIAEERVTEGQQVRKGDVLFVIKDERSYREGIRFSDVIHDARQRQELTLLKAREAIQELSKHESDNVRNKISTSRDAVSSVEKEIGVLARRMRTARETVERYKALGAEGFVSPTMVQEKEDLLEALSTQMLALQRTHAGYARDLSAAQIEEKLLPVRTRSELLTKERELVDVTRVSAEEEARRQYAITAPADGVVTSITGREGQAVGGNTVAMLLPRPMNLTAHLFAPSRAIGFIEAGQLVRLRYQAFPYQKYGLHQGAVLEVSRTPVDVNDLPAHLRVPGQEDRYRVIVGLANQSLVAGGATLHLVSGMHVDGDIEQDTRSLLEWMIEPLYSLRKTVTGK